MSLSGEHSVCLVEKLEFVGAEEGAGVLLPRGERLLIDQVPGLFGCGLEEVETDLELLRGRCAAEEQMVGLVDPGRVVALWLDPLGQLPGLGVDEAVVHEVEPLDGNVGREALLRGKGRVGKVEGLEERVDAESADLGVDGAPGVIRAELLCGPADVALVEVSGDKED